MTRTLREFQDGDVERIQGGGRAVEGGATELAVGRSCTSREGGDEDDRVGVPNAIFPRLSVNPCCFATMVHASASCCVTRAASPPRSAITASPQAIAAFAAKRHGLSA